MKIIFTEESWDDYLYWQRHDRNMLSRINALIKDISRHPFTGMGKPEPLRHRYSGYWSRRIDSDHRLIYSVTEHEVRIAKCRFHYTS